MSLLRGLVVGERLRRVDVPERRMGRHELLGDRYAEALREDGTDLRRRISSLPGFGEMKVKALGSVLAKRFDVPVAQDLVPGHPTLGDVDSAEALADYQAKKREHKKEWQRAKAPA